MAKKKELDPLVKKILLDMHTELRRDFERISLHFEQVTRELQGAKRLVSFVETLVLEVQKELSKEDVCNK